MDGTESASGGEERDPTADDGTSTTRDDGKKDEDDLGASGSIPLERPITPGQDADPEAHTLELIAKYIGGGSDSPLPKEEEVPEKTEDDEVEHGESPDAKPVDIADLQESENESEPQRILDPPVDNVPEEEGDQDGEPEHREAETTSEIDTQVVALEEDKNEEHDITDPSVGAAHVSASSFSSPETKVSGVISDPGDSFGSAHFDAGRESEEETDGENSEVARSLVKEVLSKALMINSDSDTSLKSDQDLDGIAPPDENRPDGTATLLSDDGKDGDGGNKNSKSEADASVVQHVQSDTETALDVENGKSNGTESGQKVTKEGDKPQVSEREGDFDESSPEAERVIEVRVLEDEDDGDYEAEGEGEEEVKLVCIGEGSPHPEYPMNYGNYKVCRQVAPGVKECLILETGEFIKYAKKKKSSTGSLSPTVSPRKSDDDSTTRRSLSESSGGSPRSDTEGEKKAFKIVKTPPAMKGTVFMSLKLGESAESNTRIGQGNVERGEDHIEERGEDHIEERGQVFQQEEEVEEKEDETERAGPEIQDDTQEGSGAEAEQVSDVLETSPEEVRSERKVSELMDSQESNVSQVLTRGILKNRQEVDVLPNRPGVTGSQSSPGKPPMSPRMRASFDQRDRGYRSPPRRSVEDGGRSYDSVDRSRGSYTSDYGGSVNGSYISGRQQTLDRGYQSMPTHDAGRIDHRHVYQPEVVTSPPGSGPVPGYNTLKDQQISWLKMFKLLEDEHRTELRAQYAEHQRLIQDIQDQMERELHKQQSSIQQRLDSHREILRDASPLADRVLSSLASEDYRRQVLPVTDSYRSRLVDYSSGDSGEGEREELGNTYTSPQRSRPAELFETAMHRSPQTDKRMASYKDEGDDEYLERPSTSLPVRRSLERDFDSPVRSPERGYVSMQTSYMSPRRTGGYGESSLSRSRSDATGDRLLRGGVYSSPMPISKKSANRSSASFSKTSFTESHSSSSPPARDRSPAAERPFEVRPRKDLSWRGDDTELITDSVHDDSQLSMSTRVNLREKHAKHLTDLREYYESELADLRSALSAAHPSSESAHERILRDENQELKLRCQEVDDHLHDAKVRIRDLEQKLQGLEIRANDYSARYDESQRTVLTLRGRIDELHAYVKDKDSLCADLDAKVRKQTKALQEAYKHQNDLTESNRRDKEALKRLLDKYENLEKEHNIMTGRVGDSDRKLHSAQGQIADLNKTISKLELHNKQLARENETLKHKAAIAMNMASVKTSYEESYGGSLDSRHFPAARQGEITNDRINAPAYRSMERLYVSEPEGQRRVESSQESDIDSDSATPSPLLRAEEELRKLQSTNRATSTQGFEPRLQKKYYGSEIAYPGRYRDTGSTSALNSPRSHDRNTSSLKSSNSPKSKSQARNMSRSDTHLNSVGSQNGVQSPKRSPHSRIKLTPKELSTPTRFDINLNDLANGQERKDAGSRSGIDAAFSSAHGKSGKHGQSVDTTLSRVKAGDYLSRPEWEDIYTSMAQPTKSQTSPRQNMTREERVKERLQTVDKLERRYDELQAEKRKLESALNKIPLHGRNRKMIQSQEQIESGLEKVDKEIGSVRMSLKRYQVLKSTF